MTMAKSGSWYAVVLLAVCYIFSLIDRLIVGLLVGPMKETLGLSDFEIALLQGPAFAILYAVLGVPLGRAADVWNRKNLVALAVAVWSICTLGCGLAGGFASFLVARIGVGVGEAALSPAAYSMFADMFDKRQLGRAISIFTIGGILGAGLSLSLGGAIYGYYAGVGPVSLPLLGTLVPWQMTFVSLGVPGVAVALLVYLSVREPVRAGGAREVEPISAVFGQIIKGRAFYVSVFILHALISGVMYGFYNWAPSYLIREFDITPQFVGVRFGVIAIATGVLGPIVTGLIADKMQPKYGAVAPVRTMGGAFTILAVVALFAFRASTFELALVGCGVVAFLGSAMIGLPPLAIQLATPNRMRGQISGVSLMFANLLGLGAGPVLIAGLSEFVFPEEGLGFVLMLVLASIAACGATIALWVSSLRQQKLAISG